MTVGLEWHSSIHSNNSFYVSLYYYGFPLFDTGTILLLKPDIIVLCLTVFVFYGWFSDFRFLKDQIPWITGARVELLIDLNKSFPVP